MPREWATRLHLLPQRERGKRGGRGRQGLRRSRLIATPSGGPSLGKIITSSLRLDVLAISGFAAARTLASLPCVRSQTGGWTRKLRVPIDSPVLVDAADWGTASPPPRPTSHAWRRSCHALTRQVSLHQRARGLRKTGWRQRGHSRIPLATISSAVAPMPLSMSSPSFRSTPAPPDPRFTPSVPHKSSLQTSCNPTVLRSSGQTLPL